MDAFEQFTEGLVSYVKGLRWFWSRPDQVAALIAPFFVGLVLFFVLPLGAIFYTYRLETFWKLWVLLPLCVFLSVLGYFVFTAIFLDRVSLAYERDLGSDSPALTLWQSLKLIPTEIFKFAIGTTLFAIISIIPFIQVLAPLVFAVLFVFNFYDLTLVRHGYRLGERFRFLRLDLWKLLGLGMWTFILPILLFLSPSFVGGGTLLAVKRVTLEKKPKETQIAWKT